MECQLEGQCKREKGGKHHYGMQELRELLDFIYEAEPATEAQMVLVPELAKNMKPYVFYRAGVKSPPFDPPRDTEEIDAGIIARLGGFAR
jgi:hypothetical protein